MVFNRLEGFWLLKKQIEIVFLHSSALLQWVWQIFHWQKGYLNPDLSSFCAMKLFWTLRPISQSFLAPQDCVTRGKIYVEVRRPNLWGRSPELPLVDCTGMFAFLGPILGKGLSENLCYCSHHWGVITGNCWAKECVSWRTEASSRWFVP